MSKVRDLPELTSLTQDDIVYAVDEASGPNGGRKVKVSTIRTAVELTDAEVKTKYEANADTNAFTDAEKAKLATVEANAAFQNADEVPYSNSVSGLSATQVQAAIDEVNVNAQADFRPSIVSGRILHYTGGTIRFDGVFYELVANDILLNQNITNGEVYVDLDGVVKQTASGVLAPPYTIVFAKFSTDLNDIISLTDERVKNAQNIVRGTLSDVRDVRAGASASEGSSGRVSDAMHKHNILTAAASTQTPDQANAEGTSTSLARADHVHNIPASAPTINLSPATTNTEGVASSFARADHTHALDLAQAADLSTVNAGDTENLGTVDRFPRADHQHPVATGTASGLDADSTNTEGTSTDLARADHTHDLATGVVSTQTPDQSNAEGSSPNLARADHVHNIPASAPTTNLSPATTNSEGVAASFARADHTHALDMAQSGDLSTVNAGDAEVLGSIDRLVKADHQHPVATAAASTQTPDQVNAEGASTSLARADHTHNIPTASAVGLDSTSTNTQGAASTFARSNHTHAIASGAPSTQNADQANAAGSSANFAKADHIHNIPTAAPTDIGSANSQGSAGTFVKSDHVHKGLHSIKANAGTQRFGDTSLVNGVGTTVTDDGSGNFTVETTLGGNELFVTQGAGLIANFTAGKVRINGTSYSVAASSISVATGATNGRIYVDVDGVVKSTTATTTPPNAIPLAIYSSSGVAITALSDNRSVLNPNLQFGASGDIATLNATNVAAAGATNKYADAGHVHVITTGAASTQTPDQSNATGSSASLARADHVHNIPAAAPSTTLSPATTNSKGVAASFALSDHTHAVATALVADITTIQPDDAAAAGTANTFARGDHKHAIVAAAATSISTSTTNTEGASTSFARADHTHAVSITNSEVTATADDTTSSATDTLMVGMTSTPAAGTYLVMWSGSIVNSANGAERTWVSLYLGGSQVSATERSIGTAGGAYAPSSTHAVISPNGSQAVELRWRVAGGTSTVHSRRLTFIRLGA